MRLRNLVYLGRMTLEAGHMMPVDHSCPETWDRSTFDYTGSLAEILVVKN